MKLTKLLILLLLLSLKGFTQKPFLSKAVIEPFVPISGTVLTIVSNEDDQSELLDIGSLYNFSFIFNGNFYDKLYISTNGTISLNSDYAYYSNNLGSSISKNIIAPFWDDYDSRRSRVNEGTSQYLVTGSAPNRKITIEWNKFHRYNYYDANDQMVTFQVILYENSDHLKFNYKRNTFTNTKMNASIGFKFIDDSYLAFNHGSDPTILNSSSTLVNNSDQADFSDYQDNLALYFGNFQTINLTLPAATLTTCSGTSSSPTTFGVTGSNLTASVTISAPTNFEISISSGGSYSSSLTLPQASSVSQTLYVRLNSSATFGIKSGTISATSTGASDVTTTVSGTVLAKPTLSSSSIILCKEATFLITKTTSMPVDNGWSVSGTITVNNGYVTAGTTQGTYTVSYTDGCAQTASATVAVGNSDISPAITGLASYKISNTNPIPQGPTANVYVGYNGFNYYSTTKPTNTGFYKANNQSGNNAGCPYPFYIFRCTTCPD